MKRRLLFVCVENSSRSQMAEGLTRIWAQGAVEVGSAGLKPGPHVHPQAVDAMGELGYDMRGHVPKPVPRGAAGPIDVLVALGCEIPEGVEARQSERWDIPDPAGGGIEMFRAVRDLLGERIRRLLGRGISITRDQRSLKARLLARQAEPVPMRVAASLAYTQVVGRLPPRLRESLNETALALSQVMDLYYVAPRGGVRRVPPENLAQARFEQGGDVLRTADGTALESISVRRAQLLDAIDALKRSGGVRRNAHPFVVETGTPA